MDGKLYSKPTIERFMNDNLFFKDAKLKKYFERDEQRDLQKFRKRVHEKFTKNHLKRWYMYLLPTLREI